MLVPGGIKIFKN